MTLLKGRPKGKTYKTLIMDDLVKEFTLPKGYHILSTFTASNRFIANLKMSANLSVLKQLGISRGILRELTRQELRILLSMLQNGMLEVGKEIKRRGAKQ